MSYSETSRNIQYLLDKNMKAMGIALYPQRVQRQMFERLKEESRRRDEFLLRYNKPNKRKLFDEQIVKWHEEGLDTNAISEKADVSASIVLDVLRKAGYVRGKLKDENTISPNTDKHDNQPTKQTDALGAKASKKKGKPRAK